MMQDLARQAGAVLRDGFGRVTHVEHKGATDLVTDYDRRSEALIVAALRARFPDHAVLAEEGGASGGDGSSGGYRWLVDPLDGTTNFAHGLPTFAVSIALTLDNRPIIGVVYDPMREEMFAAEAGKGATLNGAAIRVSAETRLQEALLATGFTYDLRNARRDNFREFERDPPACAGDSACRRGSARRRLGRRRTAGCVLGVRDEALGHRRGCAHRAGSRGPRIHCRWERGLRRQRLDPRLQRPAPRADAGLLR